MVAIIRRYHYPDLPGGAWGEGFTRMRRIVVAVCVAAALIVTPGCAKSSWDPKNNPTGPLLASPPASPVGAACPLLSVDAVAAAYGVSGVEAKEEQKAETFGGVTVTCDYERGADLSLSLAVTSMAAADQGQALKQALSGDSGQSIPGLGDAAAFHTPAAIVGQLVVVKRTGDQLRMVIFSGDPKDKDKFVALAREVVEKI